MAFGNGRCSFRHDFVGCAIDVQKLSEPWLQKIREGGQSHAAVDLPTRTEGFLWLLRTNLTENDGVLFIQRIPAGSHLFHDHPLHAVAALAELRELFDQLD